MYIVSVQLIGSSRATYSTVSKEEGISLFNSRTILPGQGALQRYLIGVEAWHAQRVLYLQNAVCALTVMSFSLLISVAPSLILLWNCTSDCVTAL